jgi:hypothetical protein
MACQQVAGGGSGGLQIGGIVGANIFNKQARTANGRWGVGLILELCGLLVYNNPLP